MARKKLTIEEQRKLDNERAVAALRKRRERQRKRSGKQDGTNKRVGKSWKNDIGIFALLFVLGLFMIFPIYMAIIQSVKPMNELFIFPPKLYALNPTTNNFKDMFRLVTNQWVPFSRYLFNSVFITVVITAFNVFFSSMAAFVLAKCKFPGVNALNKIVVLALLFQSTVIYLMQYMVMAKLGMINTYAALILPQVASTMNLFLMRQCVSVIPDAMIEAAKVDGAGMFRICWQIVMPNSKPALMTLIIFAFQAAWNQNGGGFIYDEALKPLPTVMQQIAAAGIARAGAVAATAVVLMIPPLLIFILAQRNVLETMAHSGIKE